VGDGNPAEFVKARLAVAGIVAQVSARTVAYQRTPAADWSVSVYCAAESADRMAATLEGLGFHGYHREAINEAQVWVQLLLSAETWAGIRT